MANGGVRGVKGGFGGDGDADAGESLGERGGRGEAGEEPAHLAARVAGGVEVCGMQDGTTHDGSPAPTKQPAPDPGAADQFPALPVSDTKKPAEEAGPKITSMDEIGARKADPLL